MIKKDKNKKLGLFLLVLSVIFLITGYRLSSNDLLSSPYLLLIIIGFVTGFIAAYYIGKSKDYQRLNPKISSKKDLKHYFGRGALAGLIVSLLLNFSLIKTIIWIITFEAITLAFYYFFNQKKSKK
ncbi:MAG: hypothetical protein AABX31_05390 [Nanoarchaeota archaeon]